MKALVLKERFCRNRQSANLSIFKRDINESLSKIVPSNEKRYTNAAIFAISFSNNDIPAVEPLRDDLLKTLVDLYNWQQEVYIINAQNSYQECERDSARAMAAFAVKYGYPKSGKSLLVYYYSGHASRNPRNPAGLCIQ